MFLTLVTKESNFLFDRELYRQVDGAAMGSPLRPTLANIFLCHYEDIWLLPNYSLECKSSYYKGYVDDIFFFLSRELKLSRSKI